MLEREKELARVKFELNVVKPSEQLSSAKTSQNAPRSSSPVRQTEDDSLISKARYRWATLGTFDTYANYNKYS